MFASATLKLTVSYLLILVAISLVFSLAIFQIAASEVSVRLDGLQLMLVDNAQGYALPAEQAFFDMRQSAADKSAVNMLISLVYVNLMVFLAGGIAAFWLANRTLKPIEQSHEAQVRFVSNASHELRTPLTIMQAELELALREKSLSEKEARNVLESTLEEVIKLSKLSNTLLELSKAEQPNLANVEMARFNLTPVISKLVKRHNTTKSRHRLVLRAPTTPLPIYANKVTIEELVNVLVDNALKYSPPTSKVKLKLKRSKGNVVLSVTNSGPGISAILLPRIFDQFYRIDKSRTKSGAGLGLSLAKKIVELHNGSLSVESGLMQPTTFVVTLSIAKKSPDKV